MFLEIDLYDIGSIEVIHFSSDNKIAPEMVSNRGGTLIIDASKIVSATFQECSGLIINFSDKSRIAFNLKVFDDEEDPDNAGVCSYASENLMGIKDQIFVGLKQISIHNVEKN